MQWISLNDYSLKYKLSISTLRRRIKADEIAYRLESGKYYLLDSREMKTDKQVSFPTERFLDTKESPGPDAYLAPDRRKEPESAPGLSIIGELRTTPAATQAKEKSPGSIPQTVQETSTDSELSETQQMRQTADSAFSTAKELLDELKKSYAFILQEREEQILQLKKERAELRELVQLLEADNTKLRAYAEHLHSLSDAGLGPR